MVRELGIGIVGYGFIGKVHTYAYQNIPLFYDSPPFRIKLVGVCAATEESARKGIDQAGFEFCTTDYRQLLGRDDIDVINCCTPNLYHKDLLIDAAKAGKHIYTENTTFAAGFVHIK